MLTVTGRNVGTEPQQFRDSKYIIAWGANIHATNVHLWPFIAEARRNGAKLVVIDPYKTRTAKSADWYLPINPGTDVALALAMMNVIINENLYQRRLRQQVHPRFRATAAARAGVSTREGGGMDGDQR